MEKVCGNCRDWQAEDLGVCSGKWKGNKYPRHWKACNAWRESDSPAGQLRTIVSGMTDDQVLATIEWLEEGQSVFS